MTTNSYEPKQKILRKMSKNGKSYWVTGYEIYDPKHAHCCTGKNGGKVAFTIRNRQSPRIGEILIIAEGQTGKPLRVRLDEVCHTSLVPSLDQISFAELFGTVSSGVVVVPGYRLESEDDDLTLSGDCEQQEQVQEED